MKKLFLLILIIAAFWPLAPEAMAATKMGWTPLRVTLGLPLSDAPATAFSISIPSRKDVIGLDLGIVGSESGAVYGFQIAAMGAEAATVVGVQAGLTMISTRTIGAQFALCPISEHVTGIQVGVLNNFTGGLSVDARVDGLQVAFLIGGSAKMNGIQLATLGGSNRLTGIAIGGMLGTGQVRGVQIAAVNLIGDRDSPESVGLQIGLFNKAQDIKGVQIGLYNSARHLSGIQFGILNRARNSRLLQYMPIVNAAW